MIEIRFEEKLIRYEDSFLHYLDQPASPETIQKLVTYCVLYSEALIDEEQASYIDIEKRVDQLRKNAQILVSCRLRLRFEYSLGGPIIDEIDQALASIEEFARTYFSRL